MALIAGQATKAGLQVLAHAHHRKDFAPLRDMGNARACGVIGAGMVQGLPVSALCSLLHKDAAQQGWSCRRR